MSSICNGSNEFDTYIAVSINTPKKQIEELKKKKIPIVFYDDENESYYDEVGGFHSGAIGWNPNGAWCGECTNRSCKDCPSRHSKGEK